MPSEGERIKAIRKALNGMSRKEFGALFGVSDTYIGNVENNNKKLSRERLHFLLVTYNVNVNYILEGIGSMLITTKEESDKIYDKFLSKDDYFEDEDGIVRRKK